MFLNGVGMATVAAATEVGHWPCRRCSAIQSWKATEQEGKDCARQTLGPRLPLISCIFPWNFFFMHCCVPSPQSHLPPHSAPWWQSVFPPLSSAWLRLCGLCSQVLDWIENHGEAFLSKHTGVGKSLHRARALQKRHEDFEEVAQVTFC